jgi:hypothetical protein
MSESDFLAQALPQPPPPSVLWITGPLAAEVSRILGHAPTQLREHYWRAGDTTVWILSEVGKEQPITAGFVVSGGKLVRVRVLEYRESRGAEVRYPAFVRQYEGAGLAAGDGLDRPVHGIAGATLSLQAMNRMARVALRLDRSARTP